MPVLFFFGDGLRRSGYGPIADLTRLDRSCPLREHFGNRHHRRDRHRHPPGVTAAPRRMLWTTPRTPLPDDYLIVAASALSITVT